MSNKMIITLDVGKGKTKMVTNTPKGAEIHTLDTKVQELINENVDITKDSYEVYINNKTYLVGKQAKKNESNSSSNKTNELHLISGLTCVTQALKPNSNEEVDIYLCLAVPVATVMDINLKNNYMNMWIGKHNLIVDGCEYNFEIKEVIVKSEDVAVMNVLDDVFEGNDICIIGLGELNMNAQLARDFSISNEERYTSELGSKRLKEIINSELQSFLNGEIVDDKKIIQAMETGYYWNALGKVIDSFDCIDKAKTEYLNEIFAQLSEWKMKKGSYKIVMLGGTSESLRQQIEEIEYITIPENAQFINLNGLHILANDVFDDIV